MELRYVNYRENELIKNNIYIKPKQDWGAFFTGSKKRGIEQVTSTQDSPKVFKTDAGHLSPRDLKTTTLDSDKAPVNRQRKESPPLTGNICYTQIVICIIWSLTQLNF